MISSHTFVAGTIGELNAELAKALESIDFRPVLAFAFVSVKMPLTKIMDAFKKHDISLFGSTGSGEIVFDNRGDFILENSAVFMLTNMDRKAFSLQYIKRHDNTALDFGHQIGKVINETFAGSSALLVASGVLLDGQAMVDGVMEIAGKDFILYGGMAGDNIRFEKTFVFTESYISDDGVVLLVLDKSKIELNGMTTSGWVSLGSEFVVNRSKGNVVYEINNQPALDLYMDYLSVSEEDLPGIGIEYPFMLKKEGNVEIIRALTHVNIEDRALVFGGSIPQGSVISFATSPGFEIMENTREKIIDFHNLNRQADLLLLFSCAARHVALGPLISTEIKLASIKWKVPLTGFFTHGEIACNEDNCCNFYNNSFTLALIRDK